MGVKKYVAMVASATVGLGFAAMAVPPTASAAVFDLVQSTPITFANAGPVNATQFPSEITQYGLSTTISDVNVSLNAITHTNKGDLDIVLQSPRGSLITLTSDNCQANDPTSRSYTFDDAAVSALPSAPGTTCASGTYKPSDTDPGSGGDETLPAASISTLAGFNGENPNGTWSLYVRDDQGADTGQITSWSIHITTISTAPITIPAFGSGGGGTAAPYPAPIAVSGVSGKITDLNLTIPGLAHTFPSDLSMILVSPAGTAVTIWAYNCSSNDVLNKSFTLDDQAATVIGAGSCTAGGTFKPPTSSPSSLPGPAPAGPYALGLASFNGQQANGQWKLYIFDGAGADGGWISATPTLAFKTTDVIAPDTLIVGKKQGNTTKTKAKIKFKSTEAGSTFKCKVDSAGYKPCKSPLKLKNLKVGKHKVFIVATDASGNTDKKALKIKWKIFKS